jgi:predicted nucleic acid-binding protein
VNRIVVSNTGPLIALAAAQLLPALDRIFEKVLVPVAVRDEIDAGERGTVRYEEMAGQACSLEVCPTGDPPPLLVDVLDTGESAVIQLALARGVGLVLMDERKGRKVAADVFHLDIVGTVGLLLHARREGIVPSVAGALSRMLTAGYYIHESIVSEALRRAGEEGPLPPPPGT